MGVQVTALNCGDHLQVGARRGVGVVAKQANFIALGEVKVQVTVPVKVGQGKGITGFLGRKREWNLLEFVSNIAMQGNTY